MKHSSATLTYVQLMVSCLPGVAGTHVQRAVRMELKADTAHAITRLPPLLMAKRAVVP
ncbi:hypothetical protein DPMN_005581 [Dreissena polymorpha]|uniref:Uncharacterized protein n=1 Tax=Dreissena polymorpha TaxID=45954 RepID=A0A9D4RWM8_DREPO|nr:hypothetical protein DPMN_005581 [Dreissena polymorpha]